MNNSAWLFATRGTDLSEALRLSRRSIELQPEQADYWDTPAEIYLRLDRLAEAEAANEKARRYATEPEVLRSVNERTQKLANRGASSSP